MNPQLKSDPARLLPFLEPCLQMRVEVEPTDLLFGRDDRAELLRQFRANELDELTVQIIATTELEKPSPLPWSQRRKATANFGRFRLEEFEAFSASFADRPFCRDHSRKSADHGGVIVESVMDRKGKLYVIRQQVRLLKPWAIEDALCGTMRWFSIGWQPMEPGWRGFVESAYCTVCDDKMFGADTDCPHWPGEVVKLGDSGKRFIVEVEWRSVRGKETSEVTFPAATGTAIEALLAAAEISTDCLRSKDRGKKERKMDPELLAALGLPPDATAEQARAAAAANAKRAQEADVAKAKAEAAAAETKRKAEAEAAAARDAQISTLKRGALAAGKFAPGDEREKLFLRTAERDVAEAEMLLATWPDGSAVPTGVDSSGRSTMQTDPGRGKGFGGNGSPAPAMAPMPALAVEPGRDERDKWRTGAAAWIFQRSGVADLIRKAGEMRGIKEELDPAGFRGMTLADLARECLERGGINTRGMYRDIIIGRALEYGNDVPWSQRESGAYNTTSDFAVLLENVMHKMLLGGYMTTPDTWSIWCGRGSVSDFRDHPRYRLGSFGKLDTKNEAGEFKQTHVPDAEKEKISASPHGNIVGLTRESLVNDDMAAFSRVPVQLGRAAKLSVEIDAYAALASNGGLGPLMVDGKTLFHADHNNINATGSAVTVAGIEADRVVLASQTDPAGNEILDMRPYAFVGSLSVGSEARTINDAKYDTDAVDPGTDEGNKFMKPNKVRGLFEVVVDTARLSGARRYMFVNPMIIPVMEVAFLDGRDTPYLENRMGWRFDGVQWKIVLDYGVGGVDFRGCVTNAGS